MRSFLYLFFVLLPGFTFGQGSKPTTPKWFCSLQIQDEQIDFILEQRPTRIFPPQFRLWNGRELIELNHNRQEGDTLVCPLSIYDAEIRIPMKTGASFSGRYVKNDTKVPGYFLPFTAQPFTKKTAETNKWAHFMKGNWVIEFLENGSVTDTGFGVFSMAGDSIYGSILTETGDYRYLNGRQTAVQNAYLQSFNGAQTYKFLFEKKGGELVGQFYINKTRKMEIRARKTDKNPLSDGFTLSQGKTGVRFRFSAKDLEGKPQSENAAQLKDKALVVQILGSWCPNCLDETRFLSAYYGVKPANVEFVGLAFERKSDFEYGKSRIEAINSRLKPPYPIWLGGFAHKDSASKALPALTGIAAFPTTIFVKANGEVLRVHTGFSGPATGSFFEEWKKEFEHLLKELSLP